jgi:drug/metabolite transporter (DMT)-like permease
MLFSTVLAMLAFFAGLELVGSTRAAILSTTEPLMTAILSTVLLDQRLTTWQMAGGLAVLAGAVLVVLPQKAIKPAVTLTPSGDTLTGD